MKNLIIILFIFWFNAGFSQTTLNMDLRAAGRFKTLYAPYGSAPTLSNAPNIPGALYAVIKSNDTTLAFWTGSAWYTLRSFWVTSTNSSITNRNTGNVSITNNLIVPSGRIGIGQSFPGVNLDILGEDAISTTARIRSNATGATLSGNLTFSRSDGTIAVPTGTINGDVIGSIKYESLPSAGSTYLQVGAFRLSANQSHTVSALGTRYGWFLVPNDSINQVEKMRLTGTSLIWNPLLSSNRTSSYAAIDLATRTMNIIERQSYMGGDSTTAFLLEQRRAYDTSITAPALKRNTMIGGWGALGWRGDAFSNNYRVGVYGVANENWGTTKEGTALSFIATPIGGVTTSEVMRVSGDSVYIKKPIYTTSDIFPTTNQTQNIGDATHNLNSIRVANIISNAVAGLSLNSISNSISLKVATVEKAKITSQGVILTKLTTAQRTALSSVEEGVMVYDTDLHKLFCYDGTTWQACW